MNVSSTLEPYAGSRPVECNPKPLVQLDEVLTMLQAFEQVSLGTFLAMDQRFEDAMPVEHTRDVVEALLKTGFGAYRCHRGGAPVCNR
jgi:hypothetical protein